MSPKHAQKPATLLPKRELASFFLLSYLLWRKSVAGFWRVCYTATYATPATLPLAVISLQQLRFLPGKKARTAEMPADLLALVEHDGFQSVRKSTSRGGQYNGPCPWCQGTDRFRVQPHYGTY